MRRAPHKGLFDCLYRRLRNLKIYVDMNGRLQRLLYRRSSRYRLDLSGFFDAIADIPYIAVKTDAPYMVENFPADYPVGKDIDLIVTEENFMTMVDRIESFAWRSRGFKIRRIHEKRGFRLRFEFGRVLHYQIHAEYAVDGLSSDFIAQSIRNRRKDRNYFVPELGYEIAYRWVDFHEHRVKRHHLEYIKNHRNSINWAFLEDPDLRCQCQALLRDIG